MKESENNIISKLNSTYHKMSSKQKTLFALSVIAIAMGAACITFFLNRQSASWIELFPGMTKSEATDVFVQLKNMNADARISSDGEIEVRSDQWDEIVYELAEMGYPQSTPSYGTFFDNLSMTMSDFEKKQALRFELQDRLQTTIKRIDNIRSAVVTISVPQETDYVWDDNPDKATASVMLTLKDPDAFDVKQADAVKKLVAFSAQQMEPDDVTVINAATGIEIGQSVPVSAAQDKVQETLPSDEQPAQTQPENDTQDIPFTSRETAMLWVCAVLFLITLAAVINSIRANLRISRLERENNEYADMLSGKTRCVSKEKIKKEDISKLIKEDPKAAADIIRKMIKDDKKS
ncbi:MAG: hypothetical protein Q4F95_10870 [Oscillospiraceae bacterium]|nr:hypothetical protein [Oscillospiraceae bacterium]